MEFSSTKDFIKSLEEIDILVSCAKRNTKDIKKYQLFNKSSIIYICSKYEVFIENYFGDFCNLLFTKCKRKNVNQSILENISELILQKITSLSDVNKKLVFYKKLGKLHIGRNTSLLDYELNNKFSYGKHGEGELIKIFKRFGFEDIIVMKEFTDFTKHFNSLTNIRNNILHEDSTPSLTHNDVMNYLKIIKDFAVFLQTKGSQKIENAK